MKLALLRLRRWRGRGKGGSGGASSNKLGDFLLFCFFFEFLLLLAGRGGEGRGWGDVKSSGSRGDWGLCADFGRMLPPHLLVEGRLCMCVSSSALDAEQRRSSPCDDRWAVSAAPALFWGKAGGPFSVLILSTGRPSSFGRSGRGGFHLPARRWSKFL